MTLAATTLEQSIFSLLDGDTTLVGLLGGARFHASPPRDSALPYVTVGTAYSRDWSTGTERGEEHRVLLSVWAATNRRQELDQIADRLNALVAEPQLQLTGHALVNWQIERYETRPHRKDRLIQGLFQIRAVTEHSI